MDITSFNLFNFNAYRTRNIDKIEKFKLFFENYELIFICIQEINVFSALKVFSSNYQVFINLTPDSKDGVGVVTLVKKGIFISDNIISNNGRIIGLKIANIQLWNIYPQSGSLYKNSRENFFREILCNLMMNWKDQSEFIFQSGDHNCTHRLDDALYNGSQHLQPSLVKHDKIHGLKDDFLEVHGSDAIMYSRITPTSKTRIDYIFSNSSACSYFQYINMSLGLDHSAMMVRYDVAISIKKEYIPRDRFFSGWVISRSLEMDDLFLENSRLIFKLVKEELLKNSDVTLDQIFLLAQS